MGRQFASTRQIKVWFLALAIGFFSVAAGAKDKGKGSSDDKIPLPSEAVAKPGGTGDKLDISDIENKYWAPKDTDFSVVQNRTYTKEKKFALSMQYGPLINASFVEGNSLGISGNYFFTERYGVQLDYLSSDFKDSEATSRFKGLGGSPDYGKQTKYYGVGFNWVPFYAKMSVLSKKIIYFDMAITPTVGMTQYDAITLDRGDIGKSGLSYGFDVTQWYFLTSRFAVRADVKVRWFHEEVVKYQTDGTVTSGTKLRDVWTDTTIFLLGGTFFF